MKVLLLMIFLLFPHNSVNLDAIVVTARGDAYLYHAPAGAHVGMYACNVIESGEWTYALGEPVRMERQEHAGYWVPGMWFTRVPESGRFYVLVESRGHPRVAPTNAWMRLESGENGPLVALGPGCPYQVYMPTLLFPYAYRLPR